MTSPEQRVHQEPRAISLIAGLRALADLAEANPDVAEHLAFSYAFDKIHVPISHLADARGALADFARAVPRAEKEYEGDKWFNLNIALSDSVVLSVFAQRDKVCERVVTGTREVTKDVPDPDALAAVPTISVTETVEDVEWVCTPLLADSAAGAE